MKKCETKRFIADIVNKNYSQANASLQKIIEVKLADRIKTALKQKN